MFPWPSGRFHRLSKRIELRRDHQDFLAVLILLDVKPERFRGPECVIQRDGVPSLVVLLHRHRSADVGERFGSRHRDEAKG